MPDNRDPHGELPAHKDTISFEFLFCSPLEIRVLLLNFPVACMGRTFHIGRCGESIPVIPE